MAASVPVMKWMGPGLLASISIASTESLGVELTKRFAPGDDAQQETTSNHLSIATGIVALINQLRKHGFPGGLDCWSKGAVPWYLIALLAVWRAQWVIWIDRTLQFSPVRHRPSARAPALRPGLRTPPGPPPHQPAEARSCVQNPGFGKAMINLNTVWAAFIGLIFLKQGMNIKQALGVGLSFLGCYLIGS